MNSALTPTDHEAARQADAISWVAQRLRFEQLHRHAVATALSVVPDQRTAAER